MKKAILLTGSCLLAAIPFTAFCQQNSAGVITYQVTMQRPGGGGNQSADDNDDQGGGSNVFTMTRTFTFNASGGKMSSPEFAGGQRPGGQRAGRGGRQGGGEARQGGQGGSEARRGGPGGQGGRFRGGMRGGRGGNAEYVDFTDKKYLRAFKRGNSDTTFYIAEDYLKPENFEKSDKTKKIAGYTCHKATAQWRRGTYTIWYTTDIPVSYSPINGLTPPDGGFVLGLQSDRMEYKATKVQLQDVADNEVKVPAPSQQLSEDELRDMRQQMMSRMRGRRNGGGNGGGNQ